jgi:mannosyltransferase
VIKLPIMLAKTVPTLQSLHLTRIALLAVLLLAFALRMANLDGQELRGDEAFGYFFVQNDYAVIVGDTIALREPHPVASYFVLKTWLALAGDSEFSLRFPGLWWGVLAAALLYRLARRLNFRPWLAVLATLLLALSPYAVWHSQDARMYAMSLALTTATVYFALEALQRQRWPWAAAYIAAGWLALHTHYYAAFVIVALNLFVIGRSLVTPRARLGLIPWLRWQAILFVLYLPWLVRAGFILTDYSGNGDSPALLDAARRVGGLFAVGESTPPEQQWLWALISAALLLIAIVRLALGSPDDRRNLGLLLLYLLVPLSATWLSAQSRPIFNERYLVAAAPPFFLLLASALGGRALRPPGRWLVDGAAGLLLLLLIGGMILGLARHYGDPAYSKDRGWRQLAAEMTALSDGVTPAQARLAENFPDPTLWYYYRGPVEHIVLPPAPNNAAAAVQRVNELADAGVQRIVIPIQPAANWDADGLAPAALAQRFDRVAQSQVGGWPVQVYAQPAGALTPLTATFTSGVQLRGAVVAPLAVTPGSLVVVHLDWRGDGATLTGAEKVFVHLLDGAGALVAQDDRALQLTGGATGSGLAAYGLRLPAELTPGPYRLIGGLYDPGAPGAPRILTAAGADHVELANVTVTTE